MRSTPSPLTMTAANGRNYQLTPGSPGRHEPPNDEGTEPDVEDVLRDAPLVLK